MCIKISFFVALLLCHCAFAETVKIENAEIEWHRYYDNILIDTSDYIVPKIKADKDKLVLEFKGAETSKFETFIKKSSRIKTIHSIPSEGDTARIVIELKKEVDYEMASFIGKGEIVVEILDKQRPYYFLDEKGKIEKEYKREPIKIEVLSPIFGKDIESSDILKGKTIVIDPGHGGEDPGARANGNIVEKNLTLKTALYLSDYLRQNGASVIVTRKSDVKRDLRDVVAFVNKIKPDAFVCLHYNSIDGRSISGTETYYSTPQSKRLASLVHKEMVLMLKRTDRGVKRARFYTIHHINCPAVLVEPVYITDFAEGMLVRSDAFKKEVAKSIMKGLKDYFSR